MDRNSPLEVIESQLRECYGRVVYSHKAQEKSADLIEKKNGRIKLAQIILSALSTTGIIATLVGENQLAGILAGILSVVLLAINSYTKKYDLGEIAQKHASSAAKLWDIRESYLSMLTDIQAKVVSEEEARSRRDELQSKLVNVYNSAPRSVDGAYELASKGLQKNEELTFSESEIDLLLPEKLRKSAV